eukprot:GFKZ01011336.1.p1 GENE.GFKZ01011336.1~~GFKZ01011336.1.p1  ORF type:complete len:501 (+),score=75.61 GFKZ01011336.1:543-2045(+)
MTETTTEALAPIPTPAVGSQTNHLPNRPALADRQCSTRNDSSKPDKSQRQKGQAKVQRAGTFSNSRLSRSNSTQGNLPRGRSFQGIRPLSSAAQAAQDGYYHRKAAKMYAEKRKAAAAARTEKGNPDQNDGNTKDALQNDVINITVDSKGVMIDGSRGSQGNQGMGPRKGSRSKMTRSSSRQRSTRRSDDKENETDDFAQARSAPISAAEADIDDYFKRKRGDNTGRRKKENPVEPKPSWDGSMPRRHSSRSFIEQRTKPKSAKVQDDKVPDVAPMQTKDGNANGATSDKQRNYRGSKTYANITRTTPHGKTEDENPSGAVAVAAMNPSKFAKGDRAALGDVSDSATSSGIPSSVLEKNMIQAEVMATETEREGAHATKDKTAGTTCRSESVGRIAVPLSGKWCDNCSGVGLHIAALLSELERHRSTESGSEMPTGSGGQKKGWKSMVTQTVLGDSKARSSSEKARLQQEVSVLRATVEFLFNKIESMERESDTGTGSKA